MKRLWMDFVICLLSLSVSYGGSFNYTDPADVSSAIRSNVLYAAVAAGASTVHELPWQDDSDLAPLFSGGKTTHAVCISRGKGSLRVAGLAFERTLDRNMWFGKRNHGNYQLRNLDQIFGSGQPAATQVQGSGASLLEQFLYTSLGNPARLKLGGLEPGKPYRLVVFTQGWESSPYARPQLVSSPTSPIAEVNGSKMNVVAPARFGKHAGCLVVVDYTADHRGEFEICFDPLDDMMSIHLAAFVNFEETE